MTNQIKRVPDARIGLQVRFFDSLTPGTSRVKIQSKGLDFCFGGTSGPYFSLPQQTRSFHSLGGLPGRSRSRFARAKLKQRLRVGEDYSLAPIRSYMRHAGGYVFITNGMVLSVF